MLGHRGSRVPGPENSVGAVVGALAAGADGVEVDVRRSADGVLMCVHDSRLRGRAVVRLPADELARRDVPRLVEVLDAVDGRGEVVIEVKNVPGQPDFDAPHEASARALVELLRGRDRSGLRVSSFDWFAIEVVRDAGLGLPTCFLTPPRIAVAAGVTYAQEARHSELHAHLRAVLGVPDAVARAHDAGLRLVVWTVRKVEQALRLRDQGVDGVICDDPAAVVAALRR